MLFYLVLFGIQIGEWIALFWKLKQNPIVATIVDQAFYVEPGVQWLVDEYHLSPQVREELKVEARASSVFMSIQAIIGTCVYLLKPMFLICPLVLLAFAVVVYHVVYHIRQDGSKTSHLDVLKHPTCRYIPHAPPASAFFRSPFNSTRPTSPPV